MGEEVVMKSIPSCSTMKIDVCAARKYSLTSSGLSLRDLQDPSDVPSCLYILVVLSGVQYILQDLMSIWGNGIVIALR